MDSTCPTCRKVFAVKPYRLRRAKTGLVFCSPACSARHPQVAERKAAAQRKSVERTCPVCGSSFKRKPSELRSLNYCSVSCSAKANMALPPIAKGERRSPATQFGAGHRPSNRLPVGSVTVRRRSRDGDKRAWVKVDEPNVWRPRAIVVWESANGPVPAGHVVHHIDGDPLNDEPTNLTALSRAEHQRVHHSSTP